MKRGFFILLIASLLTFAGFGKPTNPSLGGGLFSVSKDKQVRFAPGNLVYDGGYRFADHQYDYGGYFGWGTGGNPMLTSTDYHDYSSFDDWGSHIDGGWRTLSSDEWFYVINDRPNASTKRGAATVCGVHGLVLLPDSWNGGAFHAGFENRWNTNVYDAFSWSVIEAAGAVFLPAAGYRYGSENGKVGTIGCYWSSTPREYDSYYLCFRGINEDGYDIGNREYGKSVRLVQDY